MTSYRELVEGAARATVVSRRFTYAWFGELNDALPPATRLGMSPALARAHLVTALQSELYGNWYCTGAAMPASGDARGGPVKGVGSFVEALSAANAGTGVWDAGWTVGTVADETLVLRRGGLELRARAEDCQLPSAAPATPGAQVALRLPNELLGISPGFYMAVSDRPFRPEDGEGIVRVYWHLAPGGAVPFVKIATALLNRAGVPFRLKVVNDPSRFRRCDAGVLYVFQRDYDRAATSIGEIHATIASHLHAATPAFTKHLAAGVGLAEDVGPGEGSFGTHRTRLLADGLVRAHEQGRRTLADRVDVVVARFAEDGISLDAPYLNPGSRDVYARPIASVGSGAPVASAAAPAPMLDAATNDLLGATTAIGRRLADEAFWHEDACTWLGAEPTDTRDGAGRPVPYATLGPDLYGGTAGVAVYLAALAAASAAPELRRTAIGALEHAFAQLETVPPAHQRAFYTGWAGIAFAAMHLGETLRDSRWISRARELLDRCLRVSPVLSGFDLLSGAAGTIVATLHMNRTFRDPALLHAAVCMGDALLAAAEVDRGGSSWRSPGFSTYHNLTGFSHGAAGIGYAFVELFGATADSRYRTAAESAFDYERHWFDARVGNWPDFRTRPGPRPRGVASHRYGTFWCHGAPGIALSRLRAFEILGDERCRAEAVVALETTAATIAGSLRANVGNFSLCHGLTGNAEVLCYGRSVIGDGFVTSDALAEQVAVAGIERYAQPQQPWPCGTNGGETPSLMLGLAGIGAYYLRLYGAVMVPLLII